MKEKIFISHLLRRGNNNFDLLRLLAALAVLYTHSFILSPKEGASDWLKQVIHFANAGHLAVCTFFFLSGLLVVNSFLKNQNLLDFLSHRFGRIFPGLSLCLIISVFVIGPCLTSLPLNAYFHDPGVISYYWKNLLLYRMQWILPGVLGNGNTGLNGSLWTLPLEIRLYFGVGLLGFLSLWRKKHAANIFLIASFLLIISNPAQFNSWVDSWTAINGSSIPVASFIFGALLAVNASALFVSFPIALLCGASVVAIVVFQKLTPLFYPSFYILLIYIFQIPKIISIRLPGDYSYGVYIYGFIVQQCVAHFKPEAGTYTSLLFSVPFTLVSGAISWHFVERPCINFFKLLPSAIRQWWSSKVFHELKPRYSVRLNLFFGIQLSALFLLMLLSQKTHKVEWLNAESVILSVDPAFIPAGQTSRISVTTSSSLSSNTQLLLGGVALVSTVDAEKHTIVATVPKWICSKRGALPVSIHFEDHRISTQATILVK